MRKLFTALILLFTLYLSAKSQNTSSADSQRQLLSDLKKTTAGTERLKILIKLGSYYLYKPGEFKSDLDSADLFLNQAKELNAKLKISKIQNNISYLKAEVLFERGDQPKARIAYLQAIDNYMRSGQKEEAAQVWISIQVRTMFSNDSTAMRGLRGFEHALDIYKELHNKEKEAEVLKNIGDWLSRQGKLDEAENELLKALNIYKSIGYKKLHYTYDGIIANKRMADFYFFRKRYVLADIYLQKVLAFPPGVGEVGTIRETYYMLFQADSATGNYLSAIKNYRRYKSLTDSIFTVAKTRQIAELQLQYEKDQKVQRLENKSKLQQSELQHAGTVRNFTIAGAGVLFLFFIMGYRRYRQKQYINRLLQTQQQEINRKNDTLAHLLEEQDKLLTEKDLLLREINHRVKNNLQTVISLLESQAIYLESDEALKAMETSKHRIFSMSLIHQKLYQSEDVKTIYMSEYLPEFINYLRDSFDASRYIHFNLEVDPIQLNISQAVPLALVLNEAITNSIKYAFPGKRLGEISIKMRQTTENIELIIRDSGVGMVKATEDIDPDSLGLKLMRGLIQEINGRIQFENKNGTIITITFKTDLLVELEK
jgi:two-component sensor histidine kinase